MCINVLFYSKITDLTKKRGKVLCYQNRDIKKF